LEPGILAQQKDISPKGLTIIAIYFYNIFV
jgi:hypothetical protein